MLPSVANLTDVGRRFGGLDEETVSLLGGIGSLAGGIPRGAWGIGGSAARIGGLSGGSSGTAIPRSICCFLRHSGRISKCWV